MKERIQKAMSAAGICSRREAEEMIKAGRIAVNDITAKLGDLTDPDTDVVKLDGEIINISSEEPVYIILNKPVGYVTTMSDEKHRHNVAELVGDVGTRVYPVGRLDLNSSGLLLMTNDGALAYVLTHPKHEVSKQYFVGVLGNIDEAMEIFSHPMELDGRILAPFSVEYVRKARSDKGSFHILCFTIREGRNRQVRRMCQNAGLTVLWLQRISEGEIKLGDLKTGHWRHLDYKELEYLKKIKSGGTENGYRSDRENG